MPFVLNICTCLIGAVIPADAGIQTTRTVEKTSIVHEVAHPFL
jgi:hypothetical protein